VPKDSVQDTIVDKFLAHIIKNLEVTIRNVHIRYEDSVTNPKKPFSVGITLHKLSLRVSLLAFLFLCLLVYSSSIFCMLAVIFWH